MPLINWETILVLTRSDRYFVIDNLIVDQEPTFAITVTKLYVQVVTYQLKIIQNCLKN